MSQLLPTPNIYDVCIIGSGAGGGTAAKVLTEGGLTVVMLEAGPTEAKIFSVILYFAHTLPPIIVGAGVLLATGLKLGEVHIHARKAHSKKGQQVEAAHE